eukprot:767951-Hanusia_phi.AAC.2
MDQIERGKMRREEEERRGGGDKEEKTERESRMMPGWGRGKEGSKGQQSDGEETREQQTLETHGILSRAIEQRHGAVAFVLDALFPNSPPLLFLQPPRNVGRERVGVQVVGGVCHEFEHVLGGGAVEAPGYFQHVAQARVRRAEK